MGCIYRILCKSTGKSYIGQFRLDDPKYRINRHWRDAEKGSNCIIHQAMKKYGKNDFTVEVLCICNTQDELNIKEQEYIDLHHSMCNDNGYNMVAGGKGRAPNFHHKEEHKEKMSKLMTGRIVSDETKTRISEARKGVPLNWSEETRKKVSERSRQKATGVVCSEETKEKISKSLKGRVGVCKGQKRTDEQKKRIGDAKRGKVSTEEVKKLLSEVQTERHKTTPIPHKNCKYTEDDIRYMRNNPDNLSVDELRKKFNIAKYRLQKVIDKKLYKNVIDVPV
jgi:group I intron endonuclease